MIKRFFGLAAITIGALIFIFIVLEIYVRMLGLNTEYKNPCPTLHSPSEFGRFRDIPHKIEKPAGTYRIVILGDSFTWGQGVPFDQIYPRVLENELNNLKLPYHFEVINCSRRGWNSATEIEVFASQCRQYKPDLVIIGYVLNDTECSGKDMEITKKFWKDTMFHHPKSKSGEFLYIHSELYFYIYNKMEFTRIHKKWIEGQDDFYEDNNVCFQEFHAAFDSFRIMLREDNFKVLVVIFPFFDWQWSKYPLGNLHAKINSYFAGLNFPAIELKDLFSKYDNSRFWVCLKDRHPNSIAHKMTADEITHYITSYILPKKII